MTIARAQRARRPHRAAAATIIIALSVMGGAGVGRAVGQPATLAHGEPVQEPLAPSSSFGGGRGGNGNGSGSGLTAGVGFRLDLVRSGGLDPFFDGDAFSQSALSIGYRFGDRAAAGLALAFEWNHGSRKAPARGAQAELTTDRLSLGLEGRLPVTNRMVAFARLAPALLRREARLDDASAPPSPYGGTTAATLRQTTWIPAADISVGLAFRLGDVAVGLPQRQGARPLAFWLVAEGGYGYSAARDIVLDTGVESTPGRTDEPLRLGTLAFRGGFMRFRLALSF